MRKRVAETADPEAPQLIHLIPTAIAYIPGVPAIECDVTRERADELLAYFPSAFTIDPPDAPAIPQPDAPANTPEG